MPISNDSLIAMLTWRWAINMFFGISIFHRSLTVVLYQSGEEIAVRVDAGLAAFIFDQAAPLYYDWRETVVGGKSTLRFAFVLCVEIFCW